MTQPKPLRILQVSSAKEIGGGETHLLTLMKGLSERGHQVSLAVRPKNPIVERLGEIKGQILTIPLRNSLDILSARRLAKFIKSEHIDILHCHYARDYLVGAMAIMLAGASRLILTRHVPFPMKTNIGYRKALSVVSAMICVSESVRHKVIASRLLQPERVITIHNGIDIDRFSSNKPSTRAEIAAMRKRLNLSDGTDDTFLVGVVGQLAAHKAQDDFIKAATMISSDCPAAHFVIAGKDHDKKQKYKKYLDELVTASGFSDRFTFINDLDDLPGVLASLDLLVLPSLAESFGLVLVEAMASGTNVIAADIGGPSEIIDKDISGLLVPPNDPKSLAIAMRRLIRESKLRTRLAANAKRTVTERFSAEQMIATTEELYRAVLSSRN